MLPAGSVFFCTCDDPKGVIAALSGSQIGEEQALGRGELAVGYWFE
jgi:CRISPR-associated protein Cmr3